MERFTANSKVAGIEVCSSKSKTMNLNNKKVGFLPGGRVLGSASERGVQVSWFLVWSDVRWMLEVELLLLLHFNTIHCRWFKHLIRILGASLWRFSGQVQQGGDPGVTQNMLEGLYIPSGMGLPWNPLE
ncbi:hypothetical protein ATANTOWER_000313 [Ataeniobius toweri]|uniref:Uncharacterized protein n=1 Tax=Ataeniobius toweri TaxID=208326 RepID=A0ABU7BVX2_9TELE|nr:hypothetical protein [Ataeniobius toweri]